MRALVIALTLLAFSATAARAEPYFNSLVPHEQIVNPRTITPAFWHGIAALPSTCPEGTSDPLDGCAGANVNATISIPNFYTSAAQTGQSYFSANPNGDAAVVGTPWNGACMGSSLGYPCGPYTTALQRNDPQAAAFNVTASISGTVMTVTANSSGSNLNYGHLISNAGNTLAAGLEIIGTSTMAPLGATGPANCGGSACTGAGGIGTYLLNISQSVGSGTLTANNRPVGCTLSYPTGFANDYGKILCPGASTTSGVTWQNSEWAAVNGHGPTVAYMSPNTSGTFTLQDIDWVNSVGGTSGICVVLPSDQAPFYVQNGSTQNYILKWNHADGAANGACRYAATGVFGIFTQGYVSAEYNYIEHVNELPFGLHVGQTVTPTDIQYNGIRDWYYGEYDSHGEITGIAPYTNAGGVYPDFVVAYNTAWQDAGGPAAVDTTVWYATGGVNGYDIDSIAFTRNVSITNPVSGTTTAVGTGSTVSYTYSASSSGSPVGPGPYIVITALTCTPGTCSGTPYLLPGMTIADVNIEIGNDTCVSGCTTDPITGLSKGGVGSVWTAMCSVSNTVCTNQFVNASGVIGGGGAGYYTLSMPNFNFSNTTSAGTTAGNGTLFFSGPLPGCLTNCNTTWSSGQTAKAGMVVTDTTNPSAIPANTTVSSISGNNIVLSANVTSPGVGSGDTIVFQYLTATGRTLRDFTSAFGPMIEFAHSGYNTPSITGNLWDLTGLGGGAWQAIGYSGGPPWGAGSGNGGCLNQMVATGNLNLLDASSLNTPNATSGNCTLFTGAGQLDFSKSTNSGLIPTIGGF